MHPQIQIPNAFPLFELKDRYPCLLVEVQINETLGICIYFFSSDLNLPFGGSVGSACVPLGRQTPCSTVYILGQQAFSFYYVSVHSVAFWLVCGRNQVYWACCSAQTTHKLVQTGHQELRTYCPNIYTVHLVQCVYVNWRTTTSHYLPKSIKRELQNSADEATRRVLIKNYRGQQSKLVRSTNIGSKDFFIKY